MGTGLQGEVEAIEDDEAARAPWTRLVTFIGRQIYRLYRGWRPPDDT